MRAIVIESGQVCVRDVPDPVPAAGEVLVRVKLAGVCGTDLELLNGYGDFSGIPGHEFVGIVGKGPAALKGRRVVGEINCVCGRCDMCARGLANHCLRRSVVGIVGRAGVFAEYVAIPERNCHVVPDAVPDEGAVFTEPLAAAYQILRQIKPERRHHVAVLGTGRLGLLVAQVLARTGCELLAIGRNPRTLGLLDRKRIRTTTVGELRNFNDHDVVIDCTGSAEGISVAMRLVRPRGTIVLKTTCATAAPVDLSPLVVNEVTLLGSRCGPFGEALNALARREIDVASLVTRRLPLSSGAEAFELAARPEQIKVLLKVGE
ncbi:MAG: alcohol dehydrogenase catalytic domain-containing protein [Phycisphaerae bacterium]